MVFDHTMGYGYLTLFGKISLQGAIGNGEQKSKQRILDSGFCFYMYTGDQIQVTVPM